MKSMITALALMASAQVFSADSKMVAAPTQLDDLIRGEMSAVKVYDQVLEKVKDQKEITKLKSIRADHQNAVVSLKKHANADVKEDTQTVGPWGTFTKAWTGTAQLMGNDAAIKALSQGEEHGVDEYKEALADDTIKAELKTLIKSTLLPKQEEHIKSLKTLM